MNTVLFLFFRRMRAPLLVLIAVYAISIGVLVLIPGVDGAGQPWHFDFLHAFYFVSYTASTIGFGEIPHAFSPAQRLWVTLTMYFTVIGWLYAIGTILALIQDPTFKRSLTEQRFARSVRRLRVPFYLICGYGDTGSLLVRALTRRNVQSVVIDISPDRLSTLALEDLSFDIPALAADAREDRYLLEGGLAHPQCLGVVAVTDVDQVNVKISIIAKLVNPKLKVISRAENRDTAANLASFNTDHIINPFNIFAVHLAVTLRSPSVHLLHNWLTSLPNLPLHPVVAPPRGHWVVCGYGRFGKAVQSHLAYEGLSSTVIEMRHDLCPADGVRGLGTEAVTLRAAGIDRAVGIVAGTDADADNLSIIMTARDLNPDLYLIARMNRRRNQTIYRNAGLDLIMQGSRMIVWRILPLLTVPLLSRFLHLARHHNEAWARALTERIRILCNGVTPETWMVRIDETQGPAVHKALAQGRTIRLQHLLREPHDRNERLPCIPLLLLRGKDEILLPDAEAPLAGGDKLLFCARYGAAARMEWALCNSNVLEYVETGEERPDGYIWRWLAERHERRQASGRKRS